MWKNIGEAQMYCNEVIVKLQSNVNATALFMNM